MAQRRSNPPAGKAKQGGQGKRTKGASKSAGDKKAPANARRASTKRDGGAQQGSKSTARQGVKRTRESPPKSKRSKQGSKGGSSKLRVAGTWLRRLALTGVALGAFGVLGVVGLFWYYGRDLPPVDKLVNYQPPEITRVLDHEDRTLGEIYRQRRTVVPMDQMPRELVLSVLAAEDADFYRHEGLDYPGILRALVRDILAGEAVQGASTITQQVVKLMLLTPDRTIARKTRELILARRVERKLEKDEILHLYLNHINFGHGRYGAQEAAQYYFDKNVQDLTLAEASLIAGVPQAPALLSPRDHREAAEERQTYVLDQLERKRERYWPDLSKETIEKAREAEVELAPAPDSDRPAPEVMARARRVLRRQVGEEAYRRGGYTIYTTIDRELQKQAREAVQRGLREVDARHGYRAPIEARKRRKELEPVDELRTGRVYRATVEGTDAEAGRIRLDVRGHEAYAAIGELDRYNPDDLPPEKLAEPGARVRVSIPHIPDADAKGKQPPLEAQLELGPQGAAIVIDPRTRAVRALIGGYEAAPGFNRATQAVRQPGSSFKPIVYAYGIHKRELTPASIVVDAPAVYDQWKPQNYDRWSHEGAVPLRQALAESINVVAVRVLDRLGPKNVVSFAHDLGISTELEPSLALALGASGVRPIEMTNAYATLAAGGRWKPYRIVRRIEGPDGQEVPLPEREPPRDVMTSAEAYVVTDMLQSVVESGTAQRAKRLQRPVAGKTGTTDQARDAWFVGYSPTMVAGVWVGFDDRHPLGTHESGGHTALPIWMDVIEAAAGDRPAVDFPRPGGVTTAKIDPETGRLAYPGMEGAVEEVFVEGTVPTETARPPDVADPDHYLKEQLATSGLGPPEDEPEDESP